MASCSFACNKQLRTTGDGGGNENELSNQSKIAGNKVLNEIMPTVLAKEECDMAKWPLTHLMRLLRLYAAHRCLWDVKCKDNRNRKMRLAAIIDITAALNIGVTKEQVTQKINNLRATYRYEKKRIKQRIRKGLGAQTKLKWFALADAFLRNVPKRAQKHEDPSNSDSDLEDTIVFTINSETLMPLEKEFATETLEEYRKIDDNCSQTKQDGMENFHINSIAMKKEGDSNSVNMKSFLFKLKQSENNQENKVNPCKTDHVPNFSKKKSWELKDTYRFLQLLEQHSVIFENSLESCEFHQTLLESIAREMDYSFKSIEKRWYILEHILQEETKKILQNQEYTPIYKWWPEAEKLLIKKPKGKGTYNVSDEKDNMPTEFLHLNETENLEKIAYEECENKLLQNPILSVSSLSNMNEVMDLLCHDNYNGEDISEKSNTKSKFPKETEAKFVWHGLEEDLLEGKWSLKHTVKFLRLYGVHRCLWDLNDPDYRSRPLRNAAIEDIAASMGHSLTASHVAKKIRIFRITYMQQRKRLLEATQKGETPEILLKWFPLADSFLRPHIGLRSIKPDAKEIPQFNYQYVYANLNLIDPALLTDFRGKGTQNAIEIGIDSDKVDAVGEEL